MSTVGREFLKGFARRHEGDQRILTGKAPDPYFRILERRFPIVGSKIDWEKVPHAIVKGSNSENSEKYFRDATTLLADVAKMERISEEEVVIAIGDSAMEEAVSLPLGVLIIGVREFLELPQHLYVMAEDGSWCFSFTMEGGLAFGRATRK